MSQMEDDDGLPAEIPDCCNGGRWRRSAREHRAEIQHWVSLAPDGSPNGRRVKASLLGWLAIRSPQSRTLRCLVSRTWDKSKPDGAARSGHRAVVQAQLGISRCPGGVSEISMAARGAKQIKTARQLTTSKLPDRTAPSYVLILDGPFFHCSSWSCAYLCHSILS
jgi:hypothetical protein